MRTIVLAAALLAAAASLHAQDDTLRVLRHAPSDTASVGSVITVTFDRPVAGRLDATVPAERLFRIAPAIAGRVAWRDPVTIRFVPDEPLVPGTRFTVTIDSAFRALDGTRLTRPYQFSFRVPGARLLARSFGGDSRDRPAVLPSDGKLKLLYSAPVDLAMLQRGIRVELRDCPAARSAVPVRVVRQRPVEKDDPYAFTFAGGWSRDTVAHRFRRVVEIEPVSPLPENCLGSFLLPTSIDDAGHGSTEEYAVRTPPPFALSSFECGYVMPCNLDMLTFRFTADVKVADVKRSVHITPSLPLDFRHDTEQSSSWTIATRLAPRTTYTIVVDSALRDVDGRRITGKLSATFTTRDYIANIGYSSGLVTVARDGPHSIALHHINVSAVRVTTWFIAAANRTRALSLDASELPARIDSLAESRTATTIQLDAKVNVEGVTELPLPATLLTRREGLVAMRVEVADRMSAPRPVPPVKRGTLSTVVIEGESRQAIPASPIALVELTGLAVHAKVGEGDGSVMVTSLDGARPARGATVRYLGPDGAVIAESVTDSDGIATLHYPRRDDDDSQPFAGLRAPRWHLVDAIIGGDRATLPVPRGWSYYTRSNPFDPWAIGGRREDSPPVAATIFAERGIYRPGESMYLKGVLRAGVLGALTVPSPQPVRLTVTYQPTGYESDEDVAVRDTVITTTAFGTIADSVRLRPSAALGTYVAQMMIGGPGKWKPIAREELRVAEYRAPEFLVTASSDSATHYAGDTVGVAVAARYLFGAAMGRTPVRWQAELHELTPWEIQIPGADGWTVGEWDWSWGGDNGPSPDVQGIDTLDDAGRADLRVALTALHPSRPGRVDVNVAVTDLNEQTVTSTAHFQVHPAHLYILAKKEARGWYWSAGRPVTVRVRTVSPEGRAISGTTITASVVWRRWTWRNGASSWRDSTVRVDTLRTGVGPSTYTFTPAREGFYDVRLTASDGRGGLARTSVGGYALTSGRPGAGPPYQLPLVASAREASVGDEVEVAFDSPFDSAQGWVTIERERVLEQHRLTVRRGTNTIPVKITAAHVPNVFVSVMVLATRAARGAHPDSATQLVRAGYVEIAVKTGAKRLTVAVAPRSLEYAPRDSAKVRVAVSDNAHHGVRSEVTLWAVDEGVLALTDYATPDLVARLYQARGLGAVLWSTVPTVGVAVPPLGELEMPGIRTLRAQAAGYASLQEMVVTRSDSATVPTMRVQFRSTAFYLASAVTNDEGIAELKAQLPDNLTTYRVMAVAVGADDRFGSGDTTLLVSRQLVARPSLPRFVRAADTLVAGAVINARDGLVHGVTVDASSEGMALLGGSHRSITLAEGRGATARFAFGVPPRDSAPDTVVVRLRASDTRNGDAVESRLPVEPDFHPRAHAAIGTLRDRADVVFDLPADIDPARSTVSLRIGTSPIVPLLAAYDQLRVYPYDCTEQLATAGRALVAIWRVAGDSAPAALGGDPRARAQQIADAIVRRQRADGGIRYWEDHDWTSPWLTAYAGLFLLEARDQGVVVDSTVLNHAVEFLARTAGLPVDTGGMNRTARRERRIALGGRVAVVDFLRRSDHAVAQEEDALLRVAPAMTWEDRLRLAEVLSHRPDARVAALALLDSAWRTVTRAGARVDLPDSAHAEREFPSRIAPAARLLTASIALRPDHQLLGGLVETVLQQGRAERGWAWNTQDYASVVMAISALAPANARGGEVKVIAAGRELISRKIGSSDSSPQVPLSGLLGRAPNGRASLSLRLDGSGTTMPVYYAITIAEVPAKAPVTPDIQGIAVERWYERFDNGQPVTSVAEGDLVRVRLRITVPADREFVAIEDPLPAGLEPVDLSLKTSGTLQPFVTPVSARARRNVDGDDDDTSSSPWQAWLYGRWEDGWWSPWEHKAIHDDKVVYFARMLWAGSYSASYVARATTSGSFVRPPAHAEEMYNPALQGRSDGGRFVIEEAKH